MRSDTSAKSTGSSPQVLEQQVWGFLGDKNLKQAAQVCEKLNRNYPDFASGWHVASNVAMHLNNPLMALTAINQALTIEPSIPAWKIQKALCLIGLGRLAEVQELLQQLSTIQLTTAYQCSATGSLLSQVGMHEEALAHYQKAVKLEPKEARHYYNLACLQRSLGQIEASERNFDTDIALNPTDYEAYKIRSELRTQTDTNNHIQSLEQIFEQGIPDKRGKVEICYALAKELEDLGDAQRSFQYLRLGADTRRSYMKYSIQNDLDTILSIQNNYRSEMFDGHIDGDDNNEAIFILGMPRTGTTLVERIIASHSDVFAAGELNNFAAQMMQLSRIEAGGKKIPRDELVSLTTRLDFQKLGQAYIDSTRPFTGHTARFIDKLPLNYLYTGLIHLALPNAKIINLTRNPIDTCYSVYKQLFIDAYPFSYDLKELGQYFVAYYHLMEHWRTMMPGHIYQVSYEDLVSDIETQSRRLIEFCDLKWQPQCLKFYESKQVSTTASAVQVRQPVYESSVEKWRRYEDQLAPLISVLRDAGIDAGT